MVSYTEENYLKAIYKISEHSNRSASTNAISHEMNTSAASVTDMLKRLAKKELIHYQKHKGVTLTPDGRKIANGLIRKHRLWEVFLVEKLSFTWDQVHDIAEELEHIKSDELIERLDQFLEYPKFDPHGDPIPDADGNYTPRIQLALSELELGEKGVVVGVQEHSKPFLNYLDRIKLALGSPLEVLERFDYDESVRIKLNGTTEHVISNKVCMNLFIERV